MGILAGLKYIWEKTPWYFKWVLGIIVVPNIIVNAIIFVFWFSPWLNNNVEGKILRQKEIRDIQINAMVETQSIQNEAIIERLDTLNQHQSLVLSELIRRNK
jgi:ABC-type bacteriocin/lantibiotic exporter with double-glycine peptidase domain